MLEHIVWSVLFGHSTRCTRVEEVFSEQWHRAAAMHAGREATGPGGCVTCVYGPHTATCPVRGTQACFHGLHGVAAHPCNSGCCAILSTVVSNEQGPVLAGPY